MGKGIGYKKQDIWVAEQIPQPFTFEYTGETIEVNPVLSPAQRLEFVDSIVSIVVGASRYYPELFDFAERLATVQVYVSNVKIDHENIMRHYNWLMYTDFFSVLTDTLMKNYPICAIDREQLVKAAHEQVNHLLQIEQKSTIDLLLQEVLIQIGSWINRSKESMKDVDVASLLKAVQDIKDLDKEDKLVGKILEFRDKQKDGVMDNGTVGSEAKEILQKEPDTITE